MLRLFADLGLRTARRFEGPEVRCTIALDTSDTYFTAVEERGRAADVASLVPLLRPKVVAVVGAGRKPGSVGRAILHHLHTGGFAGRLFAVNPAATAILGVPSHPSVDALPRTPDLAVLAVPAGAVPDTAEECGKAGVRALLVVTAGVDADRARALMAACRSYGMRLVGPNCLGVINTDPALRLDATFAAGHPRPGTAGVAVQSGGVGIALLDGLSRLGIGVSSFASLGDKFDVSGNDMLQWWESDGHTDLALLHLESFGNPRAFSRTARRVTRRMPVLTVDAGRTDAGRRAAASHTAAAATRTMTRGALFTQAGITATRSVGELLETASLLHAQPLPAGSRVAIVTNAGGAGVLAADACAEAGLSLPPPTPELIDDLLAVLPDGAAVGNPVDATAAVTEEQLTGCVDRIMRHNGVDAVLVALVPRRSPRRPATISSVPSPAPRPGGPNRSRPYGSNRPCPSSCCPPTAAPSRPTPNPRRRRGPWPTLPVARPGWHGPPGPSPTSKASKRRALTPSWRPTSTPTRTAAGSTRARVPNSWTATAFPSRRGPGPRPRTTPSSRPTGCAAPTAGWS